MVRRQISPGIVALGLWIGACAAQALGHAAPIPPPAVPTCPADRFSGLRNTARFESGSAGEFAGGRALEERGVGPSLTSELYALRALAQARILGDDALIENAEGKVLTANREPGDARDASCFIDGNTLGQFVPVENESALAQFHSALTRLVSGNDPDGKLRIAAYGASHTQVDMYTGYLRYYLQSRFGDGGSGFMQLVRLNQWYAKLDFKIMSDGFRIEYAQQVPAPEHGRFGLLGAAAVGGREPAFAIISPRARFSGGQGASNFELFYSAESGGGDLFVSINHRSSTRLSGQSSGEEARYYAFTAPPGWREVAVRPLGNGPVRLFGVSIEKPESGIVLDTLGISGTRAANMLIWDEALWAEQLQRRSPDLVMLAYGTNETTDHKQPIEVYRRELNEVLTRLQRAVPEASCLLIGPGDFPKQSKKGWAIRPRLLQIINTQRELAAEFGCGFWDTFTFMGGDGSMDAWVRARPPMANPDHIHLTTRGYVRMGLALGDALLRAYDSRALVSELVQPAASAAVP